MILFWIIVIGGFVCLCARGSSWSRVGSAAERALVGAFLWTVIILALVIVAAFVKMSQGEEPMGKKKPRALRSMPPQVERRIPMRYFPPGGEKPPLITEKGTIHDSLVDPVAPPKVKGKPKKGLVFEQSPEAQKLNAPLRDKRGVPRMFSPMDSPPWGEWRVAKRDGHDVWTQLIGADVWIEIVPYPKQEHMKVLIWYDGKYHSLDGRTPTKHLTFEDADKEAQEFRRKKIR